MTWVLARQGVAYEMEGANCINATPFGKTSGGHPIIRTPLGVNVVINDSAPEPKPKPALGKILLPVVFWPQTDNKREPHRTCFSSSMAMIAHFLNPSAISGDDQYVQKVFSYGDTTDPSAQVKALDDFGVDGSYSQKLDFDDLDKELEAGYPIGLGILHRGPLSAPTGGHWIVCRGRSEDGRIYYINDPYGSIHNGYTGPVSEGQSVGYSREMLTARWTVEGKNSGWGMICRKKA